MIRNEEYNIRRVEKGDFWQLWEWNQREKLFVFYGLEGNQSHESILLDFEKKCEISTDFIIEKSDGSPCGVCSFCNISWSSRTCEVNLKIYEDSSPFMLSKDALKELMNFLRSELNLKRVHAYVPGFFQQEIETIEGAGFVMEGALRQCIYHKGKYLDLMVYGAML